MSKLSKFVSLHPYFKVHPGKLEDFKKGLPVFVDLTKKEPKNLFYEFSVNGDEVFCREGYVDELPAYAEEIGAQNRLEPVQSDQGLDIEELIAAGLEQRRDVGGAVIGIKRKWLRRRHLAGSESPFEFSRDFCHAVAFGRCGGEIGAGLLFESGQDLMAANRLLLVLLMVRKPEGGIRAEKDEKKLGGPTGKAGRPRVSRRHDSL